jgi:hypothetical protein
MESDPTVTTQPTADETVQPSVAAPPQPTAAEAGTSVAEDLPALYRALLERVARLERAGARAEAARIRHEATQAYSSAWDEAARRMLVTLILRADRVTAPQVQSRGWSLRRRSATAR